MKTCRKTVYQNSSTVARQRRGREKEGEKNQIATADLLFFFGEKKSGKREKTDVDIVTRKKLAKRALLVLHSFEHH